jgi:hypothetical protein
LVVAGVLQCDHVEVTMHATDDVTPKGPRHERVVLRMPPDVEHPENVDLATIAEIIRSGELTAEIDAANNYDPDLAV